MPNAFNPHSAGPCSVRIRSAYPGLLRSEKKATRTVLSRFEAPIGLSIGRAAGRIGASEASLLRFYRTLGFNRHTAFRFVLTQEAGGKEPQMNQIDVPVNPVQHPDPVPGFVMLLVFCAASLVFAGVPKVPRLPDYRNPSLPVERRVADLLSRMTL